MTTLSLNSVPNDPFGGIGSNPEVARIKLLIEALENYGVDKKFIFQVDDLHRKKNIPKVVKCLGEVEKLVNTKHAY